MIPQPFIDEHGQPPRALYGYRVADRTVTELLGICRGLVYDGEVNEAELSGLGDWLARNAHAVNGYPGSVLFARLQGYLRDGVVDSDERADLAELLRDLTAEPAPIEESVTSLATRALFDDPLPSVFFDAHEFVFTGRMLRGSRHWCEQAVSDRGGRCAKMPTRYTHYVVVGPIASAAWLHSTHGTKLLHAAKLKEQGHELAIIPEDHWLQFLEV